MKFMKNKVALVVDESDMKAYYKVEMYVSTEYLQDLRYSTLKEHIPAIVGGMLLNEVERFNEQFKKDLNEKVLQKLKT